jgi:hypothetical protein
MQIKTLQKCAVAGVFVTWMTLSARLVGGEAIQFSSDKTKPAAAGENPLTKDRLMPKNKLSGTLPLDSSGASITRSESRRRLDPKEERRQDNKRLEEENWMILDEGDLQAQDDYNEVYGRSDFDPEKKRTSGEIWFPTKQGEAAREPGSPRSRSTALRPPGQNHPDGTSPNDDKDTSFSFARRLGKNADTKSEGGQSKALGTQGTANQNGTDSALKDLFNTGNGPSRGRSELGLRPFDSTGSRAPSVGSSFGFDRSAAVSSSLNDSAFKSSPLRPPASPGGFDPTASKPNLGFGPITPLQPQPPADSSPRTTRGTFDVPSRPGFGR